ncbi:uncharacterized protein LOC121271973 isoform X1 [Carcharodon carcharias]|uniref:uncharacterized protein LOC121271973 isoform X1 n=1 Tax=Carcharodon carcharias TaxID=13397 RepID=UPI001B7DA966|nr:uncharacterized protein LOC121271973 isoform X1 [Carcharodon carcharias]
MQSNAIQWTAREYGLKEFLRKFRTSLSKVVKVTEGYLGRQEVDTLSASTILRIHCLYSQKRAIVECKNGSILSIPVTLESMMFNVADQKHKTGPFTMKEVLLYFNLPVTVTSTNDLTYREMNNPGSKEQQLKQLIVKRTYEQEFLLGHPINDSGKLLIRYPTVIPMYMKEIKLVIAEGINSKDETEWKTLCDCYDKVVKDIGNLDHFIFTDITLLDKDKLDQYTGEYAEIEPIYIDLNPQNPGYKYQVKQPRQSLAEAPNDNLVQSHGENKPQIPPKPNRETGSSCLVAGPTLRIKPLFKTSRRSSYIQKQKAKRIVSMSEVPDDLQHLNVDEVCDCLNLLNMGKYIETFQSQQIDGHLLFDLDRDIMQNTFGMSNFHILKMIRFREGWRPK